MRRRAGRRLRRWLRPAPAALGGREALGPVVDKNIEWKWTNRDHCWGSFLCKIWIFYMAVWALNVKLTGPLVITAGSALENYRWWTSRELQRTSGTRFRTMFWKQRRQVILAPSDRRCRLWLLVLFLTPSGSTGKLINWGCLSSEGGG